MWLMWLPSLLSLLWMTSLLLLLPFIPHQTVTQTVTSHNDTQLCTIILTSDCNFTQLFTIILSGSAPGSSVVARSLVWPGAVAVYAGKKFVNCYHGFGVVLDTKSYSPPLPAGIQVSLIRWHYQRISVHGNIEVTAILRSRWYWGQGNILSISTEIVLETRKSWVGWWLQYCRGLNVAVTSILPSTRTSNKNKNSLDTIFQGVRSFRGVRGDLSPS